MQKLYKFYVYFGRMGELEGLLIADDKEVDELIGREIIFGEVLGKHSDVQFEIEKEHFTVVTEDQDFIEKLGNLLGSTVSGINPFDYLAQTEDMLNEEEYEDE